MEWIIKFSRHALKDIPKLQAANLTKNLKYLIEILKKNPYQPPYEKLSGYILHAFTKKSKKGIETPKQDVDLIKKRYHEALELAKNE